MSLFFTDFSAGQVLFYAGHKIVQFREVWVWIFQYENLFSRLLVDRIWAVASRVRADVESQRRLTDCRRQVDAAAVVANDTFRLLDKEEDLRKRSFFAQVEKIWHGSQWRKIRFVSLSAAKKEQVRVLLAEALEKFGEIFPFLAWSTTFRKNENVGPTFQIGQEVRKSLQMEVVSRSFGTDRGQKFFQNLDGVGRFSFGQWNTFAVKKAGKFTRVLSTDFKGALGGKRHKSCPQKALHVPNQIEGRLFSDRSQALPQPAEPQ